MNCYFTDWNTKKIENHKCAAVKQHQGTLAAEARRSPTSRGEHMKFRNTSSFVKPDEIVEKKKLMQKGEQVSWELDEKCFDDRVT